MFGNNLSNNDFGSGTEGLRQFFRSALSGKYDPRLVGEQRSKMEGTGVDGGFAVPGELAPLIMDNSLESEIIRPRAQVFPMQSRTLEIPAWDADDHQDGALYGGFSLQWIAEGGTATVQTAKLRIMELTALKCGLYANMSREILEDQLSFKNWLTTAMRKAISASLDKTFIDGDGVGKPRGLLSDPARIEIGRAGANAIALADLQSMYGRLHAAFGSDAV
jgi:HK97 family phage major capsid protein